MMAPTSVTVRVRVRVRVRARVRVRVRVMVRVNLELEDQVVVHVVRGDVLDRVPPALRLAVAQGEDRVLEHVHAVAIVLQRGLGVVGLLARCALWDEG